MHELQARVVQRERACSSKHASCSNALALSETQAPRPGSPGRETETFNPGWLPPLVERGRAISCDCDWLAIAIRAAAITQRLQPSQGLGPWSGLPRFLRAMRNL